MREYFWADKDIELRVINKEDVKEVFNSLKDTELKMHSNHEIVLPANMKEAEKIIDNAIISTKNGEEIVLSVIDNHGNMVGYAVMSWIDERLGCLDCNIFIFRKYRRKGYGTKAYNIILDYVFNERRMHKVNCCTIDGNEEGPRFLYKFGFKFECVRKEMFYSHGKYLAEYYYGLLEDEYRNNNGKLLESESFPENYSTIIPDSNLGKLERNINNVPEKEYVSYDDREYFWDYEDISVRATKLEDYVINQEIIKNSMICRYYDNDVKLPNRVKAEEIDEEQKKHIDFNCDDSRLEFAITNKEGIYIGNIALCGLDYKNGRFSLSIYMVPEYRGNGYGTKALRLILSYAFFELRMNKLITVVNDGNIASARMMRKVGCKVEGVHRENAFYLGKYHDEIFFGITKKDFSSFNRGFGVVPNE